MAWCPWWRQHVWSEDVARAYQRDGWLVERCQCGQAWTVTRRKAGAS